MVFLALMGFLPKYGYHGNFGNNEKITMVLL